MRDLHCLVASLIMVTALAGARSAVAQESSGPNRVVVCLSLTKGGEPLPTKDTVAAVVDPQRCEVIARLSAGTAEIEWRPGYEVWAYAPGHDLAKAPVPESGRVAISVEESEGRCGINVSAPDGAPIEGTLAVVHFASGEWKRDPEERRGRSPIVVHQRRPIRAGLTWIEVPSGLQTSVMVETRRPNVSPRMFSARAGETQEVVFRSGRTVLLRLPSGEAAGKTMAVEVFRDLSRPAPGDRESRDTLRMSLLMGTGLSVDLHESAVRVGNVPRCALHLFGYVNGIPRYASLAEATAEIDLGPSSNSRMRIRRVLVDGAPAPRGSWVLPGRHDLSSASGVVGRFSEDTAYYARVHETDAALWIPAAQEVTVWTPERWIAHGRIDGDGVLDAVLAPGRLTLDLGGEPHGELTVIIWPVWDPAPRVFYRPAVQHLSWTVPPDRHSLALDNVPLATYMIQVVRTASVLEGRLPGAQTAVATLTQESPSAVVSVDVGDPAPDDDE